MLTSHLLSYRPLILGLRLSLAGVFCAAGCAQAPVVAVAEDVRGAETATNAAEQVRNTLQSTRAPEAASEQIKITNGPAVFITSHQVPATNSPPGSSARQTAKVFAHYLAGSLHHLIWTNFMAHTNGRTVELWTERYHMPGWPTNAPVAKWNTNSIAWGMKSLTAISPCWESEGAAGQVPVTALTRRHVYARGHGMGPDDFNTNFAGRKVWFVTTNNSVIEATVARDVVRTRFYTNRDYTILLLTKDLPVDIQPMRVVAPTNIQSRYPSYPDAPRPIFQSEQRGQMGANVPGFTVNTWKGGDSGAPDMLPMPGELVFFGGRSTSGPSVEMQLDMNKLCELEGLDPKRYQLQWLDLSSYPKY